MPNLIRRVLLVISIICFVLSGTAYLASSPNNSNGTDNIELKFLLKAYASKASDLDPLKAKAIEKGYEIKSDKAKKFKKNKNGYEVVFLLEDKDTLNQVSRRLKQKGISSKIDKDDSGQTLLKISGSYKNKADADKIRSKAKNVTMCEFEVKESYIKVPYSASVIIIKNVSVEDNEELSAFNSGKVEIESEQVAEEPKEKQK